jgi:hypothetical protein
MKWKPRYGSHQNKDIHIHREMWSLDLDLHMGSVRGKMEPFSREKGYEQYA